MGKLEGKCNIRLVRMANEFIGLIIDRNSVVFPVIRRDSETSIKYLVVGGRY